LVNKYSCWSDFYANEPEFFNQSHYKTKNINDLSDDQIDYLDLLSKTFNVRSPQNDLVPYMPYSWQIDFHSDSLLIKSEEKSNLLLMKGRGISYSYSVMFEMILRAQYYGENIYPIIANRQINSNDLIKIGHWALRNSNAKFKYNKDKRTELELYTEKGTAIIRGYPSGSPEAVESVRSIRPVTGIIDEAGFIKNLENLVTALENTMQTSETQLIIGSTPSGKSHYFWQLWEKDLPGYKKYNLPAFDLSKTNLDVSLTNQNVEPIVWWYNIDELEKKRLGNKDKFLIEYLCSPQDDSESLIQYADYELSVKRNDIEVSDNSYYLMGVDVASVSDYAVIIMLKTDGINYIESELWYRQKILLFDLEKEIRRRLPLVAECRIDSTGQGLQIFQNLFNEYGTKIRGIDFRGMISASGDVKEPVRQFMMSNMQKIFLNQNIKLKDDQLQRNHILSMTKGLTSSHNSSGHNDISWALAMALLPFNYKYAYAQTTDNPELKEKENKPMTRAEMLQEVVHSIQFNQTPEYNPYGEFRRLF
jgi:hypothetical protein